MLLAAVQPDLAWQDKPANWSVIGQMVRAAALPAGSLVALPELADTGFTMDAAAVLAGDSLGSAQALARACGCTVVAGHGAEAVGAPTSASAGAHPSAESRTPAPRPAPPRNVASVISAAGDVLGQYAKVHLFSPGGEAGVYRAGDSLTVVPVPAADGVWKVCPLICYDLRFPELFRVAALAGAEVFVVGASWPAVRAHHWRALTIARAIENQAFVVACNRVGHDPHSSYVGGSLIVGPDGTVLAEAGDAPCVLTANADRAELLRWRDKFPALRDAHRGLLGDLRVEITPMS